MGREFGLMNGRNQYNCFLNVVLQSIWVFPTMRTNMSSFCDLRSGGPEELKPFINALQDFFSNVESQQLKA